jgi:hypothetical protein
MEGPLLTTIQIYYIFFCPLYYNLSKFILMRFLDILSITNKFTPTGSKLTCLCLMDLPNPPNIYREKNIFYHIANPILLYPAISTGYFLQPGPAIPHWLIYCIKF